MWIDICDLFSLPHLLPRPLSASGPTAAQAHASSSSPSAPHVYLPPSHRPQSARAVKCLRASEEFRPLHTSFSSPLTSSALLFHCVLLLPHVVPSFLVYPQSKLKFRPRASFFHTPLPSLLVEISAVLVSVCSPW
ncbi:hypothetical protein C8R47DRAFT_1193044 [Mycena vitilis]|nr:hypothetical protein C8R47DRAFT_1193044 [Mycena vitilis]